MAFPLELRFAKKKDVIKCKIKKESYGAHKNSDGDSKVYLQCQIIETQW